jgi:hypothetical protein
MLQPKTRGINVNKPKETIANQNKSKNKHLWSPKGTQTLPGVRIFFTILFYQRAPV